METKRNDGRLGDYPVLRTRIHVMPSFESREITFVESKQPSGGSLPFLGKHHLEISTGTIFVRLSVAPGVFKLARKPLQALVLLMCRSSPLLTLEPKAPPCL